MRTSVDARSSGVGTISRRRSALFRALVERSADVLVLLAADGTVRYASPAAERLLGGGVTRRHHANALDYVHPEDAARAGAALRLAVTSGGATEPAEYRLQHSDGSWGRYEIASHPGPGYQTDLVVSARQAPRASSKRIVDRAEEAVLDSLSEIVFQTDPVGNWTFLSRAWTEITGFEVTESLGTNFLDYVHPDEREHTMKLFAAVVAGGADHCHHETRYRRADGDGYVWMELRARLQYDAAGEVIGNTGTLLDISERRRSEALLQEQTNVLELVARGAPLANTLNAISALLARHLEATVAVQTVPPSADAPDPGAESTSASGPRLSVTAGPDGSPACDGVGEGLPVEWVVRNSPTAPRLGCITVYGRDRRDLLDPGQRLNLGQRELVERCAALAAIAITRHRAEQEAQHRALHDPLTGLPNRALLADRLEYSLHAARRRGHLVGLLLIGLNRFKPINDTLGHDTGDVVLRHVAARLSSALRDSDLVSRISGDEFAVVLPELGEPQDASAVAAKVLRALEQPLKLHDLVLHLRASVGIALYPSHDAEPGALLRRADVAMHRAKRMNSRVCLYDPRFDGHQLRTVGLAAELRRAIAADQLLLHYQPKVDLVAGRVVGVEALVRWRHPSRGVMLPDQFIPLAGRTGLIKALSLWVLRAALSESRLWRAHDGKISLAVNLPVQVLLDTDLPDTVERFRRELAMDDATLEFEITENEVMADPEEALQALRRLDAAGIGVAIDDFGTGYSSLAYLKRLPASALKIDKSFIHDLVSDQRDASIVRSAIDLAHNLGISVVAEGVENAEAHQLLARMGCDSVQGYFLARPMPASELVGWLRRGADACRGTRRDGPLV